MVGTNATRLNSGMGKATKKFQRRSDWPQGVEDTTIDRNGQEIPSESMNANRMSYKNKLMGASIGLNFMAETEEGFELKDADVSIEVVDGIPSIIFSDHVQ